MSPEAFDRYMFVAAMLFGVVGAANLVRPAKRWLGAGAVLMGLAALLYRNGTNVFAVAIVACLAFACLAKDASSRVGRPSKRRKA